MSLNLAKLGLAVQRGVSPVCATCKKYWDAREKQIPGDSCTSTTGCRGPISGGVFHDYEGPIQDFTNWCFICGDTATIGIQVNNYARVIGTCANHVSFLKELSSNSNHIPFHITLKTSKGDQTLSQYFGPPKKLLSNAVQEVEDYYSKKNG